MSTFYKFIYNETQAKYTKWSPNSLKHSLEAKPCVRSSAGCCCVKTILGFPACNVRNSFSHNNVSETEHSKTRFSFLSHRGLSGQAKFQHHVISPFIISYVSPTLLLLDWCAYNLIIMLWNVAPLNLPPMKTLIFCHKRHNVVSQFHAVIQYEISWSIYRWTMTHLITLLYSIQHHLWRRVESFSDALPGWLPTSPAHLRALSC